MALKKGDDGQAVRIAQVYLNRMSVHRSLGFDLTTDGDFGSATEAAVKTAQNWYDLPQSGEIDGLFMGILSTYGASIVLPGHAPENHSHNFTVPSHSHSGTVTVT